MKWVLPKKSGIQRSYAGFSCFGFVFFLKRKAMTGGQIKDFVNDAHILDDQPFWTDVKISDTAREVGQVGSTGTNKEVDVCANRVFETTVRLVVECACYAWDSHAFGSYDDDWLDWGFLCQSLPCLCDRLTVTDSDGAKSSAFANITVLPGAPNFNVFSSFFFSCFSHPFALVCRHCKPEIIA